MKTREPVLMPGVAENFVGFFWLCVAALSLVGALVFFSPLTFFLLAVLAVILTVAKLS